MLNYQPIMGIPIIESEHLRTFVGFRYEKRTWKERLFSLPWRPFQATRTIPEYKPDENIYIIPIYGQFRDKQLVCHPSIASQLRERLKEIS